MIDGIVLLDKPKNLSSFTAVKAVKRIFNAQKAGHTGTLDPIATGMLPICLGEATKFSQFLFNAHKTYEATGVLGFATDTQDLTGNIIATSAKKSVELVELSQVLAKFTGKIAQVPPMYSALKHQGKPLYKYARLGQEIERASRVVEIMAISLLALEKNCFKIRATVSKGTYIRTLIEDLGVALGSRAYMQDLKRISIDGFANMPMYSLEALQKMPKNELANILLPADFAVRSLPQLKVSWDDKLALYQGKLVSAKSVEASLDLFSLWDAKGFFGVGELSRNLIKAKRLWRKTDEG
ncbi:MAG: tRNA pseudouridine(55) synthase TruB [Legionellales bacterium RIFCSPHIGHO2_12_FULL_37_14]|nr:MAG: tRNA pseudouridine(55) synthase TruB [Legionellales bacterium RIFCSPHIGHO2_12_FULL_37_14]